VPFRIDGGQRRPHADARGCHAEEGRSARLQRVTAEACRNVPPVLQASIKRRDTKEPAITIERRMRKKEEESKTFSGSLSVRT